MIDISIVISSVSTMFVVMCVGFVAAKLHIIDDSFSNKLSDLVIKICQPFLIISAVIKVEYTHENLKTGLAILLLGIGVHAFSALIAYFASIPLNKKFEERKMSEFSMVFSNCGFMGFPILGAVLGDVGLFWGAFYCVTFNLLEWTYGFVILSRKRPDIKPSLKKTVINYGTIPSVIGFLLFVCRWSAFENNIVGACLTNAFDYIGSLCTPISLLIIGAMLSKIPFKKLIADGYVLYTCLFKLLIIPILTSFLLTLLNLSNDIVFFASIMAGLPTAANSVMIAEKYSVSPDYAAHVVAISTLLTPITIPIVIAFADTVLQLI